MNRLRQPIGVLVKLNLLFFITLSASLNTHAQSDSFIPVNGMTIGPNYIVFEAEATNSPLGKWQIITPDDSRYKNKSTQPPINETHLEFTGNNYNFGPPTSPLQYKFKCPKTGKYRLGGRLYQRLEGLPDDKCNDVYIKMSGDFTSGNNVPTSELKDNRKFFGRGVEKWGALYNIESNSVGHAYAEYNLKEGEIYTLTVSGRAQRTNVDYWLLYETSLPITLGPNKDLAAENDEKYLPQLLNTKKFRAVDLDYVGIDGYADAQATTKGDKEVLENPVQGEWSAAQIVYRGSTGDASFILRTMLEEGGESTYRLLINGDTIGEVTNNRIFGTEIDSFSIQTHLLNSHPVALKDKDTIQILFNNTTNGLVTEGTPFSSGIWIDLEIRTTGEFAALWPVQHPIIYVTPEDRPELLEKIENNTWARRLFDQMQNHVGSKVSAHQSNPNSILNTIPNFAPNDGASESTASSIVGGHNKALTYASYAGMLYYLTEDENYAQFAADVLAYYIDVLSERTLATTTISGNYFYDPRTTYPHFAITYDFIYNFLKKPGTQVYDKESGTYVDYDHAKAQKVIRNIAGNTLKESAGYDSHGRTISNHPVLTAPGSLFSILCVDDPVERERMLNVFIEKGTKRQNSFMHTILPMFGEQGVWPESTSYSFMPNVSLVINVLDRLLPDMKLADSNQKIFEGMFLFENLRNPDRTFVRYGDSKRKSDNTDNNYRYLLNLSKRRGYTDFEKKAEIALQQLYDAEGGRNPNVVISTYDNYTALELFWGEPFSGSSVEKFDYKPTVLVKHAGVALQRNYVEENNSTYGLCGIIGGAHYVHSHCTGIAMELYGAGYVMGPNGGLPPTVADRNKPEHERYFRLYAGNNTVIVNGTSHGRQSGSWKSNSYLWQNTTVNVAAEPKHLEDPIASQFSFATQFLDDDINNCDQQRTLSTIRTSETTGYYFDMFRSKSLTSNEFHDYVYHNLGDATHIKNGQDQELDVSPTNRYQNDIGDPVQSPGWRFFDNTEVTDPTDKMVKVRFDINYNNRYMNMFIPGGVEREFTKAVGPATREAKNGYVNKNTQIIAIRQQGEAWDKPYVAIFEPQTNASASVVDVEHLYKEDVIVGAKVESQIGNKTIVDYIICLEGTNNSVTIPEYGIAFTGRFGVVRYEQDLDTAYTTLYIGEGDSLSYGDISLEAGEGRKGIKVQEGEPYFGRQLLFKNINNKDVIPKGTNLSIEAIVGVEYKEVTLWANDSINLGTQTEEPYTWSGHPFLTNMQDDVYTFTLSAKDSLGVIENETILIETPSQKPYTEGQVPHAVPGKIEFEDYDSGGEGLGYHDKSVQDTLEYTYREGDNVDLGRNGSTIASLEEGEWVEYTVNVQKAGFYKLSVRHRTEIVPGAQAFNLIQPNKGDTLLRNVETYYTGRYSFYTDEVGQIFLEKGKQVLRFEILTSGFELDYMEIALSSEAYRLLIIAPNGSVETNPNEAYFAGNTEVTLTAVPDEGYVFSSWTGDYSGSENPMTIQIGNSDVDIKANFEIASSVITNKDESIVVYPNPSNGLVTVKIKNGVTANFTIHGVDGSQLMNGRFTSQTQLNLVDFNSGIYLLEIETKERSVVRRLVIQ